MEAEYPIAATESARARACACGAAPVVRVVITEPLVLAVTVGVCARCLPGVNAAVDACVRANRRLLVDVRVWS